MKIGVDGPILTQKKHKNLYGKTISILYNMGENVMALLPIYGARDILLLFYNHQGTESE